jgi:hypothetical protein
MALRAMADRRHLLYRLCVVFVRLGSPGPCSSKRVFVDEGELLIRKWVMGTPPRRSVEPAPEPLAVI